MEFYSTLFQTEVHNLLQILELIPKRLGFKGELKYCISSLDRRESRVYYLDLRRHVKDCVIDFKGNWYDHLPIIKFSYNNSYHLISKWLLMKILEGEDKDLIFGGLKLVKRG